ncbi:MAG: N-acetyltransferase family protein [Acidimicrobiia bacterium]
MVEPVAPDAPVEIRFLRPEEAPRLTEAIERSYGKSYDAAWAYDPEEIRRRLECGVMRSIVGVDPEGEVVGHLALDRPDPTAPAGHAGQAVVDPRYRGHHLFTSLKRELAGWCRSAGLLGMYSEATAAHPYSQEANLALGAHETGFLLGYIPSQVSYTAIKERAQGRRQSVALFWLATNPPPTRVVHPPSWHRTIVHAVYEHNALEREVVERGVAPVLEGGTELSVTEHVDHNEATVALDRVGADVLVALGGALAEQADRGRDVVHVELALHDPATAALPAAVHDELGLFFGGIVPELRRGDILRLQWLNGVEADPSDVAVASEFGEELLAYVFERKRTASSI